jgi:hypothetical protein
MEGLGASCAHIAGTPSRIAKHSRSAAWRINLAPPLRHFLVQLEVLLGGLGPGVILRHAVAHEGLPCLSVLKDGECVLHGFQVVVSVVALEFKSSTGFGFRIPFFDRVIETAGGAYYGDRSIFEAVDLVQPARLVARGHQVDVGSGVYFMGEGLVIGDADGDFFREALVERAEEILVVGLACAEHDEEDVFEGEALDDLRGEIKALLSSQTRDHAENGGVFADVGSAEGVQQIATAVGFAGEVLGGVVGGDAAVGFGAPFGIVDAIKDAVEVVGSLPEGGVEAIAEFGSLDFFGVLAADGTEDIGVDNTALQKIEGVVVLEPFHGKDVPRQEEPLGGLRRKPALVAGVVDGQDGPYLVQCRIEVVDGPEVDGEHRRLPVVQVEDVGHAELLAGFENGAAEEAEPLPVVGVFAGGRGVDGFAVEEFRAIDEIELDPVALSAIHNCGETVVVRKRDGDAGDGDFLLWEVVLNLAVERDVDRNLMALPGEFFGK